MKLKDYIISVQTDKGRQIRLYEIVEQFDNNEMVQYEKIVPFKKLLYRYYKELYNCEPVLLVEPVSNTLTGAMVVPEMDLADALDDYINSLQCDNEAAEYTKELILSCSCFLTDVLT